MVIFNNISWLASYPKSGSTWLRMFINAFMTKMPLNINSAYQIARLDMDPAMLQLICPTDAKQLNHSEQYIYRPAMLLNMLKLASGRLILKTHTAKVALDGLVAHPPQMTDVAVYIIRDPRDVCISLSHHLGITIDATIEFMNNISQGIQDETGNLTSILLTWSKHVESWTLDNKNIDTLVVRYEDMLEDAPNIFMSVLKHLNLLNVRDIEERFDFALNESSFENLQEYENSRGFIEKGKSGAFFRVGKAEQWKDELTTAQAEKIYEDHSAIMEEFGYEKSTIDT
jgi:hypothetical protein